LKIKVYTYVKKYKYYDVTKKITPCPILESVVEVRFESELPSDAIFGIIYSKFKKELPVVKKLPILQLPEQFRSSDPALQYKPHYQIHDDQFIMQIGPQAVSLINKPQKIGDYVGWEDGFSAKLKESFQTINELGVFSKITRLGIRYTSFFELNIFEKINLTIDMSGKQIQSEETTLRTVIKSDSFCSTLIINNKAEVSVGEDKLEGSVLDIDTVTESNDGIVIGELNDLIEVGHTKEKYLFWNLLTPEFQEELNPEY
jgi:uncharacterized protein (TIGR04255 family)